MPAPPVGVKRSREQTNRPAATAAEVRPALDADPAEVFHRPTMDKEGRGTALTTTTSSSVPHHLTERPLFLLPALPSSHSTGRIPLVCSHDAFTHGMFGATRYGDPGARSVTRRCSRSRSALRRLGRGHRCETRLRRSMPWAKQTAGEGKWRALASSRDLPAPAGVSARPRGHCLAAGMGGGLRQGLC